MNHADAVYSLFNKVASQTFQIKTKHTNCHVLQRADVYTWCSVADGYTIKYIFIKNNEAVRVSLKLLPTSCS